MSEKRKIIDYKIIEANTDQNLREKILRYIEDGWDLIGGAIINYDGYNRCFQTMVKYE